MTMEICLPNPGDYQALGILARQIHSLHVSLRPDIFFCGEEPLTQAVFLQLTEQDGIRICRQGNEILGYITWQLQQLPRGRKRLWVDALCVRSDAQGAGIGTRLMDAACAQGRAWGCTALGLTVCENNMPALRFYQNYRMKPENIRYSMPL